MTVKCKTHKTNMKLIPAGVSRKTQKPYKAFYACTLTSCNETAPAPNEDPAMEATAEFQKEMEEEKDYSNNVEEAVKEFEKEIKEEDTDEPMTTKKWNVKAFEKSWGVFSAPARQEGMSPKQAVSSMHLFDWLDSIHEGTLGYAEWKKAVLARIAEQE